ncbi:unnamed protein product [Spodoptera exigua]|nr:unnamed protein product [Spodoptera exigua]
MYQCVFKSHCALIVDHLSSMQYTSQVIVKSLLVALTVSSGSCWQFFTSIGDYKLTNSPKTEEHLHSQYMYGDCKLGEVKFYTHVHLDHTSVLGKVIIRYIILNTRKPQQFILIVSSDNYRPKGLGNRSKFIKNLNEICWLPSNGWSEEESWRTSTAGLTSTRHFNLMAPCDSATMASVVHLAESLPLFADDDGFSSYVA